ncbi:MAG: sulfite exporter TauE/SafE family protein [Glaciecola sp.]|nr:sulfite exporter TauE/SafE family protein [Glaciecola sp.]
MVSIDLAVLAHFFNNDLLSTELTVVLILLAGFSSFITAAFGAGGGLLLLVVMALVLPMSVVIPVHGLVQLGSNANRMLLTIKHIDWRILAYFSIGGIGGAFCASFFVLQISLELMKGVLAIFVLYLLWGKLPNLSETSVYRNVFVGAVTSFLSMFVGASGPMVGSYLYLLGIDKLRFTATFASSMSIQHCFKAFVYSAVGFSFFQWMPLIFAMVLSGAFGTYLGISLLVKQSDKRFRSIFRIILSFLCLQLLADLVITAF